MSAPHLDLGAAEYGELAHETARFLDAAALANGSGKDLVGSVWRRAAAELGLMGLVVSEDYGGSGYDPIALAMVTIELGRRLVLPGYLPTMLAAIALTLCGDAEAKAELLPGIVDGTLRASFALTETDRWDLGDVNLTAVRRGCTWQLTGVKRWVIEAQAADFIVAVARTPQAFGLFVVDREALRVTYRDCPTIDLTRRYGHLSLDATPARLVSSACDVDQVELALDHLLVQVANEAAGGARRVVDTAVAYASLREQFGRPIGSFQAIKHRCADMLVASQTAAALACEAAWLARQTAPTSGRSSDRLALVSRLAKCAATDAYFSAAGESIQIHGGIGYTWEHEAHLHFKRAKTAQLLFGTNAGHRRHAARLLDIGA